MWRYVEGGGVKCVRCVEGGAVRCVEVCREWSCEMCGVVRYVRYVEGVRCVRCVEGGAVRCVEVISK